MKIVKRERLLDAGQLSSTTEWAAATKEIDEAIRSVEWPPGSGSFTLYDEPGKKRGQGNGVTPIKSECMRRLKAFGWELEKPLDMATVKQPGRSDAARELFGKYVVLEWETGNISSSHRALNKMALGLLKGVLVAGVLIVPTRNMYRYLTDRVGNLAELEPYFPLWSSIKIENGLLEVVAIEQDGVSKDVPRIQKGTEGRALQ